MKCGKISGLFITRAPFSFFEINIIEFRGVENKIKILGASIRCRIAGKNMTVRLFRVYNKPCRIESVWTGRFN